MKKDIVKKALLILIGSLGYFMAISSVIIGTSLFLSEIGPSSLPPFMIFSALFFIVFSIFNLYLSDRITIQRMFLGNVFFIIACYFAVAFFGLHSTIGIALLLFLGVLTFNSYHLNFSGLVSALVTPLQAKAILPIIFGFQSLVVIVTSIFINSIKSLDNTIRFGFLGVLVMSLVVICVVILGKRFGKRFRHHLENERTDVPAMRQMFHALRYVLKDSRFISGVAMAYFFVGAIKYLMEFKFNTVLEGSFEGDQLSSALGLFATVEAMALLFLNFFIVKRALFRFGVSNMLLFFPVLVGISLFVAVLFNFNVYLVALAYLFVMVPYSSYIAIVIQQMLSIADKHLHQEIYVVIKGIVFGVSWLLVSMILLIFTYDISLEATLNTLFIFGIVIAFILLGLRLKVLYLNELKSNLFKNDNEMRLKAIDLLAEKSYKETGENYLRKLLFMETCSANLKNRAMYSLGIIGNYQTISDLLIIVKDGSNKEKFAAIQSINHIIHSRKKLNRLPVTKHLLLEIYENLLLSDVPKYLKIEIIQSLQYFNLVDVIHFLEDHLDSDSISIRTNVIETFGTFNDRAIVNYLKPFLDDSNASVVSASIGALWQFKDQRVNLVPRLAKVLLSDKTEDKKAVLRLIGDINANWELDFVKSLLKARKKDVKFLALITLMRLGDYSELDAFMNVMKREIVSGTRASIETLLGAYRRLDKSVKVMVIRKIQQLPEHDVAKFLQAFENSNFLFGYEQAELS